MWTRRCRWLVSGGGVLLAAALFFWWASRPAPLTAEEQQFVGWWTSPDWGPDPKSLDPGRTTAVEYRADRTIRYRRENTQTGAVSAHARDEYWRVVDGELIFSFPRPNRDIARGLPHADLRARHDYTYEVIWDGPDRCTKERVKLPWGRGGWPVTRYVRCEPSIIAP